VLKNVLKLDKKKVLEELNRHWFFVKVFIPFVVSILFLLLAIYLDWKLIFILPFFLLSTFLPDILLVFLSLFSIKTRKIRRKTHSTFFLLIYPLFLFFLLPFLLKVEVYFSLLTAIASFFGVSLHLLVDSFEDFSNFISYFLFTFKKLVKRKTR